MEIVDLKGKDLERVREILEYVILADVGSLRVGIDSDGFKMSVDYGVWSPGYGTPVKR